ncbi:hypothetical protein AB0N09_39765 [Streptomyces erythrochromogenes]|uniref:hypothetical protein n=1 Tax=Streptomyces erythrochromogenes TaxID=285574 RepID=UPI00341BE40F
MLYAIAFAAAAGSAAPAAMAAPSSCRVGAYVTDLYGLDVSPRTVNADFWLWSVCPTAELNATQRAEFVNAQGVTLRGRSTEKVGDEYWSQVKVSGTFRQEFDLREYPFDKQGVKIRIEDSKYNSSRFTYVADKENSGYDHSISLGGFKIRHFDVRVVTQTYETSFGDPRIAHGKDSQYSQFVIDIRLERDDLAGFIRQAWPAYVAFLISFISYWIWADDFVTVLGARFGILGASLFSVVLSMRATGVSGTSFGVTLVDQIHLATLLYTLVGVGCTSYILYRWADPDRRASARRTNTIIGVSTTAVFLIANAVSIGIAVS